ncbi:hypothetical protein ACAG65_01720 [Halodesulfovibrio aestuarii]|uniref:hypothetical protein n=1 Tax=Halodesulfovibrio aestuarii TaxID=126333 RepID=UPI0035208B3A
MKEYNDVQSFMLQKSIVKGVVVLLDVSQMHHRIKTFEYQRISGGYMMAKFRGNVA